MRRRSTCLVLVLLGRPGPARAAPSPYFETYEQGIEIVFRDEEAARGAKIEVLPLFDGREWAISGRWDDNTPAALRMRDVLDRHGHRGTFYLNGTDKGYYGEPYGPSEKTGSRDATNRDLDRMLVRSGRHTIGGHGWTHPVLGYCSRNRMFEEVMRVRADRESSSDSPLCSYAFSGLNWGNAFEGGAVSRDIAEVLFRSGFYHVANARCLRDMGARIPASRLLPWDGAPVDKAFSRYLANDAMKRGNPNISFSMHPAAYDTPEKWRSLEGQLARYARNPSFWYCNQNEYAAYRLQLRHAKVETAREGRKVRVRLLRPTLRDLNDPVPLTFSITGVPKGAVEAVSSETARVEEAGDGDVARFHLHHDGARRLPEKIGWIRNAENRPRPLAVSSDGDFPGLRGLLRYERESLSLVLKNGGASPLRDLCVAYRLPLAWRVGVVVRRVGGIEPGAFYKDSLVLDRATADYKYSCGTSFYVAQVDFVRDGEAGRLYLSARVPDPSEDRSYPHGGFARLGPIPRNEFSTGTAELAARGELSSFELRDGRVLRWEAVSPGRQGLLDVEFVHVRPGKAADGYYLLSSLVRSEEDREVRIRTTKGGTAAVFLNGGIVRAGATELRRGANRLVVLASGRGLRRHQGGLFLRIVSAGTLRRVTGIRFEAPGLPPGPKE